MADDREEILNQEIETLEEKTKVLAAQLQEVVGVDCSFGACVFDPEMTDIEDKIADVQSRKATLEKIMDDLDKCQE